MENKENQESVWGGLQAIGEKSIRKSDFVNEICVRIDIVNKSDNPLPDRKNVGDAGFDIRANLPSGEIVIKPRERKLISTGIHVAVPIGYELQVRPRSGLALKHGVTVLNTPGCVDAPYRGEVGVILINHGTDDFVVQHGDRIAQVMISPYIVPSWNEVASLDETDRGQSGFGDSGIK